MLRRDDEDVIQTNAYNYDSFPYIIYISQENLCSVNGQFMDLVLYHNGDNGWNDAEKAVEDVISF